VNKILLIDDDALMLNLIKEILQADPYEIKTALNGSEGLALAAAFQPDLILCDINLPDLSGLDLCRQIKQAQPKQTLIFLSGLGEEIDLVLGLESGADDYLVKPFRIKEFRARIRAALRRLPYLSERVSEPAAQAATAPSQLLSCQELTLDLRACQASLAGVPLALTHKEFELLHWLMQHPGQLFTRLRLLEVLWSEDLEANERSVDALVRRLRKKLQRPGQDIAYFIETLRGMGYRFRSA